LFNEDGTLAENGGCTKLTVRHADLTVYQTVTDLSQRQFWMKIPVPDIFTDWNQFDLNALWGNANVEACHEQASATVLGRYL
jgi:hypothetical protein